MVLGLVRGLRLAQRIKPFGAAFRRPENYTRRLMERFRRQPSLGKKRFGKSRPRRRHRGLPGVQIGAMKKLARINFQPRIARMKTTNEDFLTTNHTNFLEQ
jgi:hypothetical protein